ncbi:hypothetical protein RCOM_0755060 [Ricinus communis]|uniref:Reverse transcriptase zinc-binding domain-containing protein n=1 Tax=Ricinus communis TaxID=3988 RepID=B9SYG9_RICCO|nr:hypothetical protein RCOM_0755060 [Ricinus communis]
MAWVFVPQDSLMKLCYLNYPGDLTRDDALWVQILCAVYPPNMSMGNDQVVWNHSANGIHSSKSVYERIRNVMSSSSNGIWEKIWKWKGPQGVRSTLWLTSHERLVTSSLCVKRLILPSLVCPRCYEHEEDTLHAIRDSVWQLWLWRNKIVFGTDSTDPSKNISWNPPPVGWIKLNVDGGVKDGKAGATGLIRDSNGNWISGFVQFIGDCPVLEAEL